MPVTIHKKQHSPLASAIVGLVLLDGISASAADFSWSAFGTGGYAISDQPYTYERFTNDKGTFKRDSILGTQVNADLSPQWGVTLQAIMAPSTTDDDYRWEAALPWSFVSYRPSNDLLLRVGKMRMPMYLFSANMDIGASYDVMHLPTEVYSTAPTTDFTGASFSKTYTFSAGDLNLEGYLGRTAVSSLHTRSGGLVAAWRQDENVYRIGLQKAYIGINDDTATALPGAAPASPGNQNSPIAQNFQQPKESNTDVVILGVNHELGNGFRLLSEYARRHARNMVTGKNTNGAYLTLQKKVGTWTPYVTVSRLLSEKSARGEADKKTGYDDQNSWSMGTSYSLSSTSKIKGEWMRVHAGSMTSLVSSQSGSISNQDINIYSVSYSFVF